MMVADTSFLVACLDHDDARQEAARKTFDDTDTVVIPTEILVETLGVVKAKAGQEAARRTLAGLMAVQNVHWQQECRLLEAHAIYEQEKRLSLPDAIVVQACIERRAGCLTFDARQADAVRRCVG